MIRYSLWLITLFLGLFMVNRKRREQDALKTLLQTQHQLLEDQTRHLNHTERNLNLAYQRIDELETRCARQHRHILALLKKHQKAPYPAYEFYLIQPDNVGQIIPIYKN